MTESVRNRWPKGLVRHLRLDDSVPLDQGYAIREEHDGGLGAGGSIDIDYTLVVHPKWRDRVEEYRAMLERNPELGGVFSPPRDLPGGLA